MNLRLRQITASDLEMVLEWRTMPKVSRYMFSDIEPDMDQQRAWSDRIQGDDSRHDWIIEVDGSDVEVVSRRGSTTRTRCEWAYYLASPEVRGRGIGRAVELNILEFVFDVLGPEQAVRGDPGLQPVRGRRPPEIPAARSRGGGGNTR